MDKTLIEHLKELFSFRISKKILKKNFFNICSFLKDRERQSMSREGAEKEGDTESEAGSRL